LINETVDLFFEQKDFSTFNFLQWYVAEQHEEEHLFQSLIDKVNLITEEGQGKFWIDKEIGLATNTSTLKSQETPE